MKSDPIQKADAPFAGQMNTFKINIPNYATVLGVMTAQMASQAAVENAKVQFGYTDIKSPLDGRLGSFTVKPGNVVMANSVELCTINEIEPIYVTFGVPESQLPAVKKYMAEGKLPVRAQPQDDANAPSETGTLTFVDNSVDVTTGTITLKGTFPNSDRRLWPGQYVRVTLRLTTQANATTVPNEAVMTGQNGSYIYVVKQDRSVDTRNVVSGARVGQDMVITSGLQPGETVVTEGQLRLAPGSHVVIRPAGGGGGGGGRRAGADQGQPQPAPAADAGSTAPAAGAPEKGSASGATGEHKGRGGRGGRGGKDGHKGPPQN